MATQFNLLPWREIKRANKRRNNWTTLIVISLLGILMGGLYWLYQNGQLGDSQKALHDITRLNRSLQNDLRTKRELDRIKKSLKLQVKAIRTLQGNRASVTHMVEELSKANSQDLFLTEFTLKDGQVDIQGIAKNDAQISNLMTKLEISPWYQEPQLIEIIARPRLGEEIKRFKITSQLLLPGSQEEEKGEKNG